MVNARQLLTLFLAAILLLTLSRPGAILADDPPPPDPILIGAGDIASCALRGDYETAKLIEDVITANADSNGNVSPQAVTVFTAGDNAYPNGTVQQFHDCYGASWDPFKTRTRPTPGNHDYVTPGAAPYFDYFGKNAGPAGRGYYSYNLGQWHIISLNSNVDGRLISNQGIWLRADLEANKGKCLLAYWHHPLYASTIYPDRPRDIPALWQLLYLYGASVVVNGHIHAYERFAPQMPDGTAAPDRGIREFVVGTGGADLRKVMIPGLYANSEVRDGSTWGVIKFTLHPTSYDWEFIPVAGGTFTDSGSAPCVSLFQSSQ